VNLCGPGVVGVTQPEVDSHIVGGEIAAALPAHPGRNAHAVGLQEDGGASGVAGALRPAHQLHFHQCRFVAPVLDNRLEMLLREWLPKFLIPTPPPLIVV